MNVRPSIFSPFPSEAPLCTLKISKARFKELTFPLPCRSDLFTNTHEQFQPKPAQLPERMISQHTDTHRDQHSDLTLVLEKMEKLVTCTRTYCECG